MNKLRLLFVASGCLIGAIILAQPQHQVVAAINPVIISGGATGQPGPAGPSAAPQPSVLCIYNQKYTLDTDDEFQSDSSLSISATPSSAGSGPNAAFTTMWSDILYFSQSNRRNNVGSDDSFPVSEGPNLNLANPVPSWLFDGTVATPYPISIHTASSQYANDGYLQITAVPVPASHSSTVTTQAITSTGSQAVSVTAGTGTNFTGRSVEVDPGGSNNEVVTITATSANTVTANFTKTHPNGISIGDPTLCPPSAGSCAHWLTGQLEAAPISPYGYSEWSGQVPSTTGAWPAYWLVCASGCTANAREYDVIEYFSTALSCAQTTGFTGDYLWAIQQTNILSYSPASSYAHRTCVPGMDTRWHTYGVLSIPNPAGTSSPGFVQFFVDRVAQTPFEPTSVDYPQTPLISLQIFTQNAYAPGPPSTVNHITMYTKYFRHYAFTATPGPATTSSPPIISAYGSYACQSQDVLAMGNTLGVQPPTPFPTNSPVPTPTPTATPTANPYVTQLLADGAVQFWQLNELSGSTAANDASGGSYNGTIGSSVSLGQTGLLSGLSGQTSFGFPASGTCTGGNASGCIVQSANNSALQPSTNLTVIDWIKFASITNNNETVAIYGNEYNGGPPWKFYFPTIGNGELCAQIETGASGTQTQLCTASNALSANTAHMIALTFNGTVFSLWVDPTSTTPAAQTTLSSTTLYYSPSNNTLGSILGQDIFQVDNPFVGNQQEFSLSATTFTGSQLETLYTYH